MAQTKLTADIDVTLTVAGVESELCARVEYYHVPASRGYHEKGGQQIDPDEPESVEIQAIYVLAQADTIKKDIYALLTEKQLDAIASQLLADRDDYEPDYRTEE